MATIQVNCLFCSQSNAVRKHGVKDKILGMAMNSSGVRGTARVLKVAYNTVLRTLKNSHLGK